MSCPLCPRVCPVDRAVSPGRCGETATLRIASYGRHFGEEPPISGTRGSGAFFFSGCPCHCFFCQNEQISRPGGLGDPVTPDRFLQMALSLLAENPHNLNFVTPDHVWPHIETLARALRDRGVAVPFVFNSSGYHAPALLDRALPLMDVFLPDFKFATPALAAEVMGDSRYPDIALAALSRIAAEKGYLYPFDPSGAEPAQTGLLVRHLVLPGHVPDSIQALETLRREFGATLPLSIMSQYTPNQTALARGAPWNRRLTPDEYQTVLDHAVSLGFANLFGQPLPDPAAPDPFTPDFTSPNPFSGNPPPPSAPLE
jgi:putative pyruvate formate lyase activating enzyme